MMQGCLPFTFEHSPAMLMQHLHMGATMRDCCCRRATLAHGMGCLFRAKGGMALQAALPGCVDTLAALARASPEGVRLSFLHSLWLTATSAGLAFLPHVKVRCCHHARAAQLEQLCHALPLADQPGHV